jgi:hypothetical protein
VNYPPLKAQTLMPVIAKIIETVKSSVSSINRSKEGIAHCTRYNVHNRQFFFTMNKTAIRDPEKNVWLKLQGLRAKRRIAHVQQ